MAQNDKIKMLKVILIIVAIIALIYGLGFAIFPGVWLNLSGGSPVEFGWLRWPGGILIALGIGIIMVFRKPEKQGIFVVTIALSTLFSGLGMLYSWIMKEYNGSEMFIGIPTCLNLVLSGLLWWGRKRAKGIL